MCVAFSLRRGIYALSLLCFFFTSESSIAADADIDSKPASHKEYVATLMNDCFHIAKNTTMTRMRKRRILWRRFSSELDFEFNLRMALGSHWSGYSNREQRRLVELYSEYLMNAWLINLARANLNIPPKISDRVVVINKQDKKVGCSIKTHDDKTISLDIRVRDCGDQYRILDIAIENMSIAMSSKRQFDSLIEEDGPENLISNLRVMVREIELLLRSKIKVEKGKSSSASCG